MWRLLPFRTASAEPRLANRQIRDADVVAVFDDQPVAEAGRIQDRLLVSRADAAHARRHHDVANFKRPRRQLHRLA